MRLCLNMTFQMNCLWKCHLGTGRAAVMFVPSRAAAGGCCSISLKQPHQGKLRQKEIKGEAKFWVRNSLGIISPKSQIFPILTSRREGCGWFVSAFSW